MLASIKIKQIDVIFSIAFKLNHSLYYRTLTLHYFTFSKYKFINKFKIVLIQLLGFIHYLEKTSPFEELVNILKSYLNIKFETLFLCFTVMYMVVITSQIESWFVTEEYLVPFSCGPISSSITSFKREKTMKGHHRKLM